MKIFTEDDGDKCIKQFKQKNAAKGENNLDLIIMDYNMVNMNGDDATREVIIYKKIKRLILHEGYVDCFIVGHSSDYSQ